MLRMCVIVTTADCESEFSELKPFKAPLRNCIGQENLNLAMQLSVKSGGVLDVLDFKNTKKKFCWKNCMSYKLWVICKKSTSTV